MANSCTSYFDGLDNRQVFSTASPSLWNKLQPCHREVPVVCSNEERKIIQLSLESFESVDKDDLMVVLDAHDCHYLPSVDKMAGLLSQLLTTMDTQISVMTLI